MDLYCSKKLKECPLCKVNIDQTRLLKEQTKTMSGSEDENETIFIDHQKSINNITDQMRSATSS